MAKIGTHKSTWERGAEPQPSNKNFIRVDTTSFNNPIELKHSHTKWLSVRWLGRQVGESLYEYRGKVYKLL